MPDMVCFLVLNLSAITFSCIFISEIFSCSLVADLNFRLILVLSFITSSQYAKTFYLFLHWMLVCALKIRICGNPSVRM